MISGAPRPQTSVLAQGGKSLAAIVYGKGDEYAARKLAGELRRYADGPQLLAASEAGRATAPVAIYIGTLASNPALAALTSELGWKDEIANLPPEGYLVGTGSHRNKRVIVLAGGDRTGAIYAASDLKNFYLERSGASLSVSALHYAEAPKMKYRWFWNWDNRTDWDPLDHDDVYGPDLPPTTSVRPFRKRPEAFVKNMKLCIDYMSEHKLNGLIVWGFLRDTHGGIAAAQEVCRYANERGVKIIPGVGIDRHYGGFYHEGKNEYNLETRAEAHPELRSMDKNGNYEPRTLCLEKPENREWLRRGFRWLYANFPIGGVNVEFAEHTTCYTKDCIAARKRELGDESDFAKDLARIAPFVLKTVHEIAPETAISYVTYGGFTPAMQAKPPLHARVLPDYAICEWTLTNMLTDLVPGRSSSGSLPWPDGLRPPTRHSLGYMHWNAFYTHNQKGFFVDAYREAARRAYRAGFEGLDTYGEESADNPNVELSYLAFSEFSFNPEMTAEDFLRRRVAPLYGGQEAARIALEIASRVGPIREGQSPRDLPALVDLAYGGRRLSAEYAKARWDKLIRYVSKVLPE